MIPPREWTDLAFLNLQPPNSQDQKEYIIRESQFSLVICGPDHGRWVGYNFIDDDSDEEDLAIYNFDYEVNNEDPISLGKLDADQPIWDPREYYLTIVNIRMAQVLNEWECLIRAIERSVKNYVC